MKHTIALFAALLVCLFCFNIALASDTHMLTKGTVIYADPGYYGDVVRIINEDGMYDIAKEQTDAYGNLWGMLKSGEGWAALSSEDYPITLYAGDQIFSGPGYDFADVKTIEADAEFTVVSNAWDARGNLWGMLQSGEGWIFLKNISAMIYFPIFADFASEELIAKGPYEYIAIDKTPEATEIAIYANETLTDVCFFESVHDGDACTHKSLHTLPALTTEKPIVAAVSFYGDMTTYGISFTDASGAKRCFEISLSGVDGSVVLIECPNEHS